MPYMTAASAGQSDGSQNLVRGAGLGLDIVSGLFSVSPAHIVVREISIHQFFKALIVVNLTASTRRQKVSRLLETPVVRTENHRHVPYRRLKHIMYPDAETASDVCHIAISVNARKQSETVDYQAFRFTGGLFRSLSIAYCIKLQLRDDLPEMILPDHMRSDNQPPVSVLIEETDKQILIRRPAAAGDEHLMALPESLDKRQMACLTLYLKHTVETRVAGDVDISDAKTAEQSPAYIVLNEETCETFKHIAVCSSVPTEEHLIGTEDAADTVHRNIAVLQNMQIVPPELVFYEKRDFRMHQIEKSASIIISVKRKITNNIRTLIILSYLVSRRRKECEQDLIFGMLTAQTLHNRTPLLKLSER